MDARGSSDQLNCQSVSGYMIGTSTDQWVSLSYDNGIHQRIIVQERVQEHMMMIFLYV